jgi:hypothetical protein
MRDEIGRARAARNRGQEKLVRNQPGSAFRRWGRDERKTISPYFKLMPDFW